MTDRLNLYKNTSATVNELRNQRSYAQKELWKVHREKTFQNSRILTTHIGTIENGTGERFDINNLRATFHAIKQNPQLLLDFISKLSKAISEIDAKTESYIKNGIIAILVECLTYDSHPQIQYEAVYALANIAAGPSEQTNAVAQSGVVPLFIRLLGSVNSIACEIAAWALGNIIGDSSELRDYVINCGVLRPLLNLIIPDIPIYTVRTLSWMIKNICRHKDSPLSKSIISELLPALRYLVQFDDADVLFNALWALTYLSKSRNDIIEMLIKADIIKYFIPPMLHNNSDVQRKALGVIGNIAKGTDEQTQFILDHKVLSNFPKLLNQPENRINSKAMWILSNIAAGNEKQTRAIIDHGLLPLVVQHLDNGYLKTQKEAVWLITNLSSFRSHEQIAYLVQHEIIPPLCQILSLKDTVTIENVLKSLCNILKATGNKSKIVQKHIERCGVLNLLEQLEEHENHQISLLASEIVESYYTK